MGQEMSLNRMGVFYLLLLICGASVNAQTFPRAFAVASVKPSMARGLSRVEFLRGGRFVAVNASVHELVNAAYGLTGPSRVAKGRGCPGWVDSERFNIEAVSDVDSSPERSAVSSMRAMVQQLLAERFALVISRQAKELAVYELTTTLGGVKLTRSGLGERDCQSSPECHSFTGSRLSGWRGIAVTIADLASAIEAISDRPVVDSTHISGLYSIETRPFASIKPRLQDFVANIPEGYPLPPQEPPKPSLFSVLEKDFGLSLRPARAKVEIIHIESIARPSSN